MRARIVDGDDYDKIYHALVKLEEDYKLNPVKGIHKILSADIAFDNLVNMENVWIVEESYLVVFDIGIPFYSDALVLQELLVLRLSSGDFSCVTAFMEQQAREAGCAMVVAGTALTHCDKALASLYHRYGFKTEALTIVKELP